MNSLNQTTSFRSFLGKYLGDRPFWRAALALALPIALQNLLMSMFTLVDTLMVSQLGDVALSSVGMAGQWSWLYNMTGFGLSSGTAVFISQYWGVKDQKGIRRSYGIMMLHTLALSVIFAAVGLLFPEWVIRLFNKDPEVIKTGVSYLRIACFAMPALALTNTVSTLLRSTENVRLPMLASLAATVCNAVFNYFLIFGKLGFPALGVKGAAIATVGSAWANALVLIIVSLIKKNIAIAPLRDLFSFTGKELLHYYRVSLPVVFNESMWGLGTLTFNRIFGALGYEYYSALTIYRTVEQIAFIFFVGLCNACCVMVGKDIGAGRVEEAKRSSVRFSVLLPIGGIAAGILVFLLRAPIVHLFALGDNLSALTVTTAAGMIAISACEYVFRYYPYIAVVGIFRAGGDTVVGMVLDIVFLWILAIPLTLLSAFVFHWPVLVSFACMLFGEDVLKCIVCVWRFRSFKWIRPLTRQGAAALESKQA